MGAIVVGCQRSVCLLEDVYQPCREPFGLSAQGFDQRSMKEACMPWLCCAEKRYKLQSELSLNAIIYLSSSWPGLPWAKPDYIRPVIAPAKKNTNTRVTTLRECRMVTIYYYPECALSALYMTTQPPALVSVGGAVV